MAIAAALLAGACAQTQRPAGRADADPLAPEVRARVAAFVTSGSAPTTAQTVHARDVRHASATAKL
jgi:hypothetical protein